MPVNFQLISKHTGEPAVLAHVDEELCERFGVQINPIRYALCWKDVIGLRYAIGMDYEAVRTDLRVQAEKNPDDADYYQAVSDFNDYLEEKYDLRCWHQSKF